MGVLAINNKNSGGEKVRHSEVNLGGVACTERKEDREIERGG